MTIYDDLSATFGGNITTSNNLIASRLLIDTSGIAFQGASNTNITPSSGGWQFATDGATQSFHFGRLGFFSTREVTARLQIDSTTQGFLPPRMTNAQRSSISSPAVGLMVYCTDAVEGLYVYKSTGWTLVI